MARQFVVLGEVAWLSAALGDSLPELFRGLFGNVLVETARACTRDQDAFDCGVFKGAEGQRVRERTEQVSGIVTFAERQHSARVVAGRAMLVFLERIEEGGGRVTDVGEGAAQLVEIGAVLGMSWTMAIEDGLLLGSTRAQRVASDTGQVGLVDEQLVFGDAHWEDLGDVVVGQRVPVAIPCDEALDVAQLVEHACGVVGVARQRSQQGLLLCEKLEPCVTSIALEGARVGDRVHPMGQLASEVGEIAKAASAKEAQGELVETPLDPGLGQRSRMHPMQRLSADVSG